MGGVIDRSVVQELALFQRMAAPDLDAILSRATSRRYAAGTTVFEQGASADSFFVLLHGRLRVTQVTQTGQQVVIRVVNPGDLFGIARALRRPDYPGTAMAVSEGVALCWPMSDWDAMLDEHPALAVDAIWTIGMRLQEAQARLRELATEEVERRVAHAVLRLGNSRGARNRAAYT